MDTEVAAEIAVAFDRIEKAWMTVGGGGEDERVEWPEPVYELEEALSKPTVWDFGRT